VFFAVGLYVCFQKLSDYNIFIILYGVTSMYFAAVMVRSYCCLSCCLKINININRHAVFGEFSFSGSRLF